MSDKLLREAIASKYGFDVAEDYLKQQEVERIQRRNQELLEQEQQKRERLRQKEIDNAISVANEVGREFTDELLDLTIRFREKLYKSKELDYDINKKIVFAFARRLISGSNTFDNEEIEKIIKEAYNNYEYGVKYGLKDEVK